MARLAVAIIFGFLAVSQVYGNNLIQEIEKEVTKATAVIDKEVAKARSSFKGAWRDVTAVHHDIGQKTERLNGLYNRAIRSVDSKPVECQKDVKKNLMVLKATGVGNFFTCSKLLEATKDIGEIGITTADLVFDVFDIGRDITMGFSGCLSSWWPWKIVGCWYDRISTTYDDIKSIISNIKSYSTEIGAYAHNASVLIEYCWNGNSAESDVLSLMTPLHQCANEKIPYDLYKL